MLNGLSAAESNNSLSDHYDTLTSCKRNRDPSIKFSRDHPKSRQRVLNTRSKVGNLLLIKVQPWHNEVYFTARVGESPEAPTPRC